jgi:hypothetical protein
MINLALLLLLLGALTGVVTALLAARSPRRDYLPEELLTTDRNHQIFFPRGTGTSSTFRYLTKHMLFLQGIEKQLRGSGSMSVHDFSDGLYRISSAILRDRKFRYRWVHTNNRPGDDDGSVGGQELHVEGVNKLVE